jgi:hypothetical protein
MSDNPEFSLSILRPDGSEECIPLDQETFDKLLPIAQQDGMYAQKFLLKAGRWLCPYGLIWRKNRYFGLRFTPLQKLLHDIGHPAPQEKLALAIVRLRFERPYDRRIAWMCSVMCPYLLLIGGSYEKPSPLSKTRPRSQAGVLAVQIRELSAGDYGGVR